MIVIIFPIQRVTIFLHRPRVNRIGRGVGLYIGEHLNYKKRHDLVFPENKSAESFFVEINRTKEKNIIIIIITFLKHPFPTVHAKALFTKLKIQI